MEIDPEAIYELAIRRSARLRIHGEPPEPIDSVMQAISDLAKGSGTSLSAQPQVVLLAETLVKILKGQGVIESVNQSVSASQFNMASKVNTSFDCVTYQ